MKNISVLVVIVGVLISTFLVLYDPDTEDSEFERANRITLDVERIVKNSEALTVRSYGTVAPLSLIHISEPTRPY